MHTEAIIFVLLIATAYVIGKKNISRFVERIGRERNISAARTQYVNTVLNIAFTIIAITASGMIIGVGLKDLSVLLGSMFAVLGVALFAQWSILSNVTASIIVFFFFPYRVGDFVKILDGENSLEGTIKEITLFHVILNTADDSLATYPNSLVFQKAVTIQSSQHKPAPTTLEPEETQQWAKNPLLAA